jgi:urease accessory protein
MLPSQPRALGAASVGVGTRQGRTALQTLRQSGSLKLLFPRVTDTSEVLAVSVNTAGGITGGDRFDLTAEARQGSQLTLTTQAAERIYRASGAQVGRVRTQLSIGDGARLDWLPQETILFDRSALRRRLDIEMAADATVLMVEPLVFGRAAMGETLRQVTLNDHVRLRRGGDLVFADAIRLRGDAGAQLANPFRAAGAGASASVLFAAPNAAAFLPRLRALLPDGAGASLIRPGILFARLLAADSLLLRRSLIPVIQVLRGAPIPKTWTL